MKAKNLLFVFVVVSILLTGFSAPVYASNNVSDAVADENAPECPYKDTGSAQPVNIQTEKFQLDGHTVYAVDFKGLTGCAVLFEGRVPWQIYDAELKTALLNEGVSRPGFAWDPWEVHMIVDVQSKFGQFNPESRNKLIPNLPEKYASWFVFSEGSFWYYDPKWNTSNLDAAKPSLAQELEVKKFRDAMKPGKYNYPRVIMQPDGKMFVFWQKDSGDDAYAYGVAAGCTKTDMPETIPVFGLNNEDGKGYSAAIGIGNCKMAYWADDAEEVTEVWNGYQKDGTTIATYQKSVIVYVFPHEWTDDQVSAWIKDHPYGKTK